MRRAADWVTLVDSPAVHQVPWKTFEALAFASVEEWPEAADLEALDFFCGTDPDDPTGEQAVWRLVAFLQALAPFRLENATRNCRLTIVTRNLRFAAIDVFIMTHSEPVQFISWDPGTASWSACTRPSPIWGRAKR